MISSRFGAAFATKKAACPVFGKAASMVWSAVLGSD
jgi:hypothetical protein